MKFPIEVKGFYKTYKLHAEIIETSKNHELIKVKGKGQKYLILKNNRPFFNSRGLKKRRWNWEIIEGKIETRTFYEDLVAALENHLR